MFGKKKITWEEIVTSYKKHPRDVITVPLRKSGIWFYVYVENDNVYIENAKNHTSSAKLKCRRTLEKCKLDAMLSIHYRRKNGEAVTQEAIDTSYNQVYWYGIFSDMGL
jgi:hypothetical protein